MFLSLAHILDMSSLGELPGDFDDEMMFIEILEGRISFPDDNSKVSTPALSASTLDDPITGGESSCSG